jgi:maltooligosyltrehalose trehalohydrolase
MSSTTLELPTKRRLPVGTERRGSATSFRVWGPKCNMVAIAIDGGPDHPMTRDRDGYFSAEIDDLDPGTTYKFRIDGGDCFPDPASRFQPQGPHGPSQIVDAAEFKWTDHHWPGIDAVGQVLYELHIGTFTPEGTWAAAIEQLPALKELGITCLEVMPVSESPGTFGWGYDGVGLFAPWHVYGSPDDFRAFVDTAHGLGIAVILDVVYNHIGPDGNYLPKLTDHFFNPEHTTDWGDAINFDGEHSGPVREFFVANAVHWITEYHLDGFRFDATQAIVDGSPEHILSVIDRSAREAAAPRKLYLINENEPQHTKLVRSRDRQGYGLDALWNDDFHHSAMVALTGHNEAYYTDYLGKPQEFISAAKYGYLYQGQRYKWQKERRGTPGFDLPPTRYVHFLQNHDQVANSGRGWRVDRLSSPPQLRAMTALWLLMPQTPMFFQGQEFAAPNPFYYFADHNDQLRPLVKAGRAKELSQFASVAVKAMQDRLVDPGIRSTFEECRLDHATRSSGHHRQMWDLHRDLLLIRKSDPAIRKSQSSRNFDGAVLGPDALVFRFFADSSDHDRLLLVNFGTDVNLDPAPEPLLAPPPDLRWMIHLTTEDPKYGGCGTAPVDTEAEGWLLPGRTAVLLHLAPVKTHEVLTRIVRPGSTQAARRRDRSIDALQSKENPK